MKWMLGNKKRIIWPMLQGVNEQKTKQNNIDRENEIDSSVSVQIFRLLLLPLRSKACVIKWKCTWNKLTTTSVSQSMSLPTEKEEQTNKRAALLHSDTWAKEKRNKTECRTKSYLQMREQHCQTKKKKKEKNDTAALSHSHSQWMGYVKKSHGWTK